MAETDQERSGKEVVEEDVEAGGEIDPEANEKREDPEKPGTSERRLSIFIFLATLVGSLLGAAADLSDARGLVLPILQIVNPVRQVRVVGSNTVLGEEIGLAAAWEDAFEAKEDYRVSKRIPLIGAVEWTTVDVTAEGVGSVAGFERAKRGEVDLLVMSEPMLADRYRELTINTGITVVCAAEIGYDVIAFVTDVNSLVPDLYEDQLVRILVGETTNWSEIVGPDLNKNIEILARQGSGTTELVLKNFANSTEFPSYVTPCENNTTCLNAVLNKPGSLYWVSTAWLRTQPPRYLRPILVWYGESLENPLHPRCATVESPTCFETNKYHPDLVRPLYMYVLGGNPIHKKSTEMGIEFLHFVVGTQGQAILEERHLYTHFDPPAEADLDFSGLPGFDQKGPNGLRGPCSRRQPSNVN